LLKGDVRAAVEQAKHTTFVLGYGTEQFADSWGYFWDRKGSLVLIAVQSRRTNNPFTQEDLEQQLKYFEGVKQHWVLIIVTGGKSNSTMGQCLIVIFREKCLQDTKKVLCQGSYCHPS
jgi:hypothetical protein